MKIQINFAIILSLLFVYGPVSIANSATITPKSLNGNTLLITIEEGDTLWELANKYLEDPGLWREFKKYNSFTDPNLIFPGEKLRVPKSFAMPAQSVITAVQEKKLLAEEEIKAIKLQLNQAVSERADNQKRIDNLKTDVASLQNGSNELRQELDQLRRSLEDVNDSSEQRLSGFGERLKRMYKGTEKESEQLESTIAWIKDELGQTEKVVNDTVDKVFSPDNDDSVIGLIESVKEQIADLDKKIQVVEEQNAELVLSDTNETQTTQKLISEREEGSISDEEFLVSLSENGLDSDEKLEELHQQGVISTEEMTAKKSEVKKKRTTILITAVAGGIAWLAVSALGGN
ncbi:MAG: LysM peptidoglycan-binding domain-containing protein [Candidatus Poribacteria bacterium]|nr:LysM peptidoglycan-binding domain-containing protein [Candidatus Poribacteria bacterium]